MCGSFTLLSMAACGKFGFGLEAFDSSIHVECADSEILDVLDRYIFPPLVRATTERSSPDIFLRVDRSAEGFAVFVNDELAAAATDLHDGVRAAVKALDDAVVHRMKMFRAVHAGAVLIDGSALLLPGSSHAGKSSLVAEMLRRGASCFSDEYALLDHKGWVHSYPRPLLLRNGRPRQSLFLPEDLGSTYAVGAAPVGWIFALDYVSSGAWDVHEIEKAEAVMLLLRNTPHEMAISPAMVDFFLHTAAHAVCYAGQRCEVAEAATHVLKLIRGT